MESPLCETAPDGVTVFETMRYEPGQGPVRMDLHLDRMARGATALGFPFDRALASDLLHSVAGEQALRLRLALSGEGAFDLTQAVFTPENRPWTIQISETLLHSDDPWLRIKTSHRPIYGPAYAARPAGVHEWVFLNERGEVAEGTITNVFIEREGVFLTPPLTSGVLPGVLRQDLLDRGLAREAVLRPADLVAGGVFMGNCLRGLISVSRVISAHA